MSAWLDELQRAAAAEGLGRVGSWRSAPRLGEALRDRSWAVRRAAGLALLELDAPGRLVLRRATSDADRFASEMARLALDETALPERAGETVNGGFRDVETSLQFASVHRPGLLQRCEHWRTPDEFDETLGIHPLRAILPHR